VTKETVLVIGAHPDDEILGLGGTLARHVHEGDDVHVLILCEGMSLRYPAAQDNFLLAEAREAATVLGLTSHKIHGFPDQRLDRHSLVEIAAPVEQMVRDLAPTVVYTHWPGDINRDHKLATEATLVAARCKAASIQRVYAYETPSETEYGIPYNFSPNHFVEISPFLERKLEAMRCYASQVSPPPNPRSVEHLRDRAHYWGQMMMMHAAEAFVLLRSYRR
jgi:LmbE family N-acetylglucosaminyl deacetylase